MATAYAAGSRRLSLFAIVIILLLMSTAPPAFGHADADYGYNNGDCDWDGAVYYNVFGFSVRGISADWSPEAGCSQVQAKVLWLDGTNWKLDSNLKSTPAAAVWSSYGDHVSYTDANIKYFGTWWGFRVNH